MSDSTDGPDEGSSVDYWQVTFATLAVVGLVLAALVAPPLPAGESSDGGDDPGESDPGQSDPGGGGGNGLIDVVVRVLEVLIDGGGEPRQPTEPPCRIAIDQQPTPGAELTVRVTRDGEPVVDAVVWFNDDRVGRTDERGTVTGRVPYERELRIRVLKEGLEGCSATVSPTRALEGPGADRPRTDLAAPGDPGNRLSPGPSVGPTVDPAGGAVGVGAARGTTAGTDPRVTRGSASAGSREVRGASVGPLEGGVALAQSDEDDDNESVSLEVGGRIAIRVDERPYPGERVTVVATIEDVPMRRATVSVDGEAVAETDDEGRATITVPEADEIRLTVERGEFSGSRTVDVYLLELGLDPAGLVLVPGGEATLRAEAGGEPVSDATVTVAGRPAGTTGPGGTREVALPADPTAPVVVSTDRQTTSVSLLGLYWLPLSLFAVVVACVAGLGYRYRGRRAAGSVLAGAVALVTVLVAGGYWGRAGALVATAGVLCVVLAGALVRYRRSVASGAQSAGGLLAGLVEKLVGAVLWIVGGLERAIGLVTNALARVGSWLRSLPRSVSGLVARLVGGFRSFFAGMVARVAALSGRALGATVLAGLGVAGAYWVDGRRGAVVAAVLAALVGVVWRYRTRERTADPDESAEPDDATSAATRAAATGDGAADWTVRELWRQFARRVVPGRWRTSTPAEVARLAVRKGYPAEPVRTLATAFREVEYGNRSPTTVARDRLEAAYDSLRGTGSGPGDSGAADAARGDGSAGATAVEEPTPESDAS